MQVQNIILDLDNTLLHGVKKELDVPFQEHFQTVEIEDYTVFVRPHLQAFLDFIFTHFNVAVFTAAGPNYAKQIVEKLFPRKPVFIFSTPEFDRCKLQTGGFKDLEWVENQVPFQKSRTLIIDDMKLVKMTNGDHCYNIKPFYVLHEIKGQIATAQFKACSQDEKKRYLIKQSVEDDELLTCMKYLQKFSS